MSEISIIDFSKILNQIDEENSWTELAGQVRDACHKIGFMYIVNHGIPSQIVQEAFEQSLQFFESPLQIKKQFLIDSTSNYRGYTCSGQEILSSNSSYEFREAFSIVGMDMSTNLQKFPETQVPNFKSALESLQRECIPIVLKLLKLMAKALFVEDDYFVRANKGLEDSTVENRCTLRTHFYPAISLDLDIPPNSVRCGAHTDYGICTLLFQDDLGGLEVLNAQQKWIEAPPIENSILVNLGDIMEIWTGHYFKATCHRVLIPETEGRKRSKRQSIAYFIQTDDDHVVSPVESSLIKNGANFKPFVFKNHLNQRLGATYKY